MSGQVEGARCTDALAQPLRDVVTETSRSHARAGVTRIHHSSMPDYRVLLLDSRRDGLPPRTENAIVESLRRNGLDVDLDAVSDSRGMLRVLKKHPRGLDGYDAVMAVAPLRTHRRSSSDALTEVLQRLSSRTPTLLIDHVSGGAATDAPAGPPPAAEALVDTLSLPTDLEPLSSARLISAALLGLLEQLQVRLPAGSVGVDEIPAAALRLRKGIGPLTLHRLERITELARDHAGLAVAEVNLLQGDAVITVASSGAEPRVLSVDDSLCEIALRSAGILVMADTWLDPDGCRRAPTQGPDAVRFYIGCPLHSATGRPIGVLCIWDLTPHDAEEIDFSLLHDLALLVEGELIHA